MKVSEIRRIFFSVAQSIAADAASVHLQHHFTRWKKSISPAIDQNEAQQSAAEYIQCHLPKPDLYPVKDLANDCEIPNFASQINRYINANGIPCVDTLYGYFVTDEIRNKLRHDMDSLPLRALYENICACKSITTSYAAYKRFRQYVTHKSTYFYILKKHPRYPEYNEFFDRDAESQISTIVDQWCTLELGDLPSDEPGFLSIAAAAAVLGCTKELLADNLSTTDWILQRKGSVILLAEASVATKKAYFDSLVEVEKYAQDLAATYHMSCHDALDLLGTYLKHSKPAWLVSGHECFIKDPQKHYFCVENRKVVHNELSRMYRENATYALSVLKNDTEHTLKELKDKVDRGLIDAQRVGTMYYVVGREVDRIKGLRAQYVSIDDVLAPNITSARLSLTLADSKLRNATKEYLLSHEYFGISIISAEESPLSGKQLGLLISRLDALHLQKNTRLFFLGYGLSVQGKIDLLLKLYESTMPDTVQALQHYISSLEVDHSETALFTMIDGIFTFASSDLSQCSEDEIERELICNFRSRSRASCSLLSDFLVISGFSARRYEFSHSDYHPDVSPYPVATLDLMVAATVDHEYWAEHDMVHKAVHTPRFADAWLGVALHVFAAWRWPDYLRCPIPPLKYTPDLTLKKLGDGAYEDSDARYVARGFLAIVKNCMGAPQKTRRYGGIPDLYIYDSDTWLVEFGIILSIAAAHASIAGRDNLVKKVVDKRTYIDFFGTEMAEALDNKNFSSRRANKILMQVIQSSALCGGDTPHLAYMIAMRMRSHKSGYGRLSTTTDVYLRNSALHGCSIDDITELLFDRGICSFVVDKLLAVSFPTYESLTANDKNEIICSLGLTPAQLDDIVRCVQTAEDVALEDARTILRDSEKNAVDILDSLLCGFAVSKDQQSYCICIAAHIPCKCLNRANCFGCRYEVRTKAMLANYIKTYAHELSQQQTEHLSKFELAKSMWICEKTLRPAIAEIIQHLDRSALHEEFELYKKIAIDCARIEEEKGT